MLLTTVNWDGGPTGNGTDFLTPANWAGDVLPLAGDTAVIGATGTSPTITISGAPAVQTVNATRNIQLTGGTLSGGTWTFSSGAALSASSSGGTLSSVAIAGDLLLNATGVGVILAGNTSFTTARLSAGNVNLAMAPGYTLNSLVVAEGAAGGARNISLATGGAGTVTFGPSAVVRLAAGTGGPLNILNSSVSTLVNNGLITAEASGGVGQQILIQNSTLTNNGTLQVMAGAMTVSPTNWTNAGTITGTGGSFNIGGTLNATGGMGTRTTSALAAVNVTGTITNTGHTINLNATTGSMTIAGGTITNGSIVATGGTNVLTSTSGGTLSGVAITGDLLLNSSGVGVLVTGSTSFTTARLTASNVNLAMAPGYVLNSTVVAEGAAGGARRIELGFGGAGTVTFGPSAVVRLASGTGGPLNINNSSAATLINNGLITSEMSGGVGQQILIQNSTLTNNGTIQAISTGALNISPTNWTNPGTITAASGCTLNLGGSWSNAGTITATSATTNLGGTFTTAGMGSFTRSGTTNLTGTLNNTSATLLLNATTGSLTMAGGTINNGSIVTSAGANVLTSTSSGTLSSVAITGDLLLNSSGVGVLLTGSTSFTAARLSAGNVNLAMAPGYTLNSLVVAEGAAGGARNISLAFGGVGTATFGPSAIVRLASGTGGPLNINNSSVSTLVNNGLITAEAAGGAGQQILIQNSTLTNNGTLQVTAGALTVNPTNWTTAGTVNGTGGTLNIGGTLNAAGGIGTFTTSALAAVNVIGTITNTGNTINLNGTTGSWNVAGGTINNGSMIATGGANLLATTSGGTLSNLAITGDVLLNAINVGLILAGSTSFTTARLSAGNVNLAMAPGYTLNSQVVAEGAAGGARRIELAFGGAGTVTFGPSAVVRLAAGSGGALNINNSSVATLVNNGLITAAATGQTLTIQNSTLTSNGTLQATAGTMNVASPSVTITGLSSVAGTGALNVDNAAATVAVTSTANATVSRFRVSSLTVDGMANAATNGSSAGASVVTTLAVGAAGKFDLRDNDLIVKTTSKSTITNYVRTAYNFGGWDGPSGIFSSTAQNNPNGNTTLGLLSGIEFNNNNGGQFNGQTVNNNDVLVKYTYYGDVDFNGTVDVSDYNLIDFGYSNHLTGWANGDVDYSGGATDVSDYNLIDFAFATHGAAL